MDNGSQDLTASDIRRMNRAELNEAASSMGINHEDYTNADDLRAAMIERLEGQESSDGNSSDDDQVQEQKASLTSPDRSTTLEVVVEPVIHNHGRRIVNVVKSAKITRKEE